MTVMLDSSSTVTCLAAQLARFKNFIRGDQWNLKPPVCSTKTPALKSISAGGLIQNNSSMVGSLAQETLELFTLIFYFSPAAVISAPDFGSLRLMRKPPL